MSGTPASETFSKVLRQLSEAAAGAENVLVQDAHALSYQWVCEALEEVEFSMVGRAGLSVVVHEIASASHLPAIKEASVRLLTKLTLPPT